MKAKVTLREDNKRSGYGEEKKERKTRRWKRKGKGRKEEEEREEKTRWMERNW